MKQTLLLIITTLFSLHSMAQDLPTTTLTDINGHHTTFADMQPAGRPMIILFYATWCKPAINMLNTIGKQYATWQRTTGVKVVVVSIDKEADLDKLRTNMKQAPWCNDVIVDSKGDVKRAMAVQMIPHLFVVGPDGNIVKSHRGYSDGIDDLLLNTLKTL